MRGSATSIHCVPSSDAAFAAHAQRVLEATRDGLDPAEAMRLFETRLRVAYPNAVVRAKEPLASLGTPEPLWYVIRDGHNASSSITPVALVADDEPLVRELLGRLLSRHGWRVIVTPDGKSALVESAGVKIDLLVTDYEMPDMSGIELAAHVRDRNPTTRIVIVSAHDDLSGLVEIAGIGVLPKPFEVRDLLEHVFGMVGLPVDGHSPASGDDATTA